jgi:hypothetical protein
MCTCSNGNISLALALGPEQTQQGGIILSQVQRDITWATAPVEVLLHMSTGLQDTSMAQPIMHKLIENPANI